MLLLPLKKSHSVLCSQNSNYQEGRRKEIFLLSKIDIFQGNRIVYRERKNVL